MGQPLVSIIVPVYNLIDYLDRCVESLLGQTCKEIEIILVDDGSTDGSGARCDEYAGKDARIKVIHKANGGLVSAWKRGLKESTCPYVSFVDGDDWIDTGMIEDLLTFAKGGDREIISCDYLIEQPGEIRAVYQGLAAGEYDRNQLEKLVFPKLLGNENRMVCLSRCMKLISRELIEKNAHYSEEDLRMGEDVAVMLPTLLDCDRLVVLEHKAYYHYYYNPASMVHKYDSGLYKNIQNLRRIIGRILQDKASQERIPVMLRQADKEYLLLLFLALKNEARGNPQGYYRNIKNICTEETVRRLAKSVKLQVAEKANKLLYLVLKHPNYLTIHLLRAAMLWYYRKS